MDPEYTLDAYLYNLPQGQIAQFPAETRDRSRLLVLDCRSNSVQDGNFTDILNFIRPGDLLVVNDTRVFPARLEGRKETGGKIELFLLEYPDFCGQGSDTGQTREIPEKSRCATVTGLLKSSKKPRTGSRLYFSAGVEAEVEQYLADGKVRVKLCLAVKNGEDPDDILQRCGRVPLPPYIHRNDEDHPADRERYQTLFARKSGAVAAPTAGLHFSEALLAQLGRQKVQVAPITLHVGYGTFAPVRVRDIRRHRIHEEYVEIGAKTAELINMTRAAGRRIWAVGTTTARALEFAADADGRVDAKKGWCGLYIYPGYKFKVINTLITNFHLPGSSLLFLVAALAGRSTILHAYDEAIRLGYRFYSYGDAMLIIT